MAKCLNPLNSHFNQPENSLPHQARALRKCRYRGAVSMPLQGGGRHQAAMAHPLGRRSLALGDRRQREGGMMPRGQQIDHPACQLDVPDAKLIF